MKNRGTAPQGGNIKGAGGENGRHCYKQGDWATNKPRVRRSGKITPVMNLTRGQYLSRVVG